MLFDLEIRKSILSFQVFFVGVGLRVRNARNAQLSTYGIQESDRRGRNYVQGCVDVIVVLPDVEHDSLTQWRGHPLSLDLRAELGHVAHHRSVHDDAGVLLVTAIVEKCERNTKKIRY